MKDLKEKTIRGGVARILAQGANFVCRIGSLMLMARLLEPHDFGLVGMVTAFTGALELFRDFGLSTATVQREHVTDEQLSVLFWINVLIGLMLWLGGWLLAPVVVRFYREPTLLYITTVLAIGFPLNALGVQHSALLQRQLRFTSLAVINVISLVVSTLVGVTMAMLGFGYWSLVAMALAGPAIGTPALWIASGWMPRLPRRGNDVRSLMRFGGTATMNGVVVYLAYNAEKVLLGRFWGADAVGIYGRAYQLVNVPTSNLNSSVGEVAFAALARLQHDHDHLKSYFLKGYAIVLAATIPITITSAIFADDLIVTLLGPKWVAASTIFRLLAPTILVFAMINPLAWLLLALGMVTKSLKIALVLSPLVIGGYIAGLSHGPVGVALGYSLVLIVWVIPHIAWCVRGTPVSLGEVLATVARPLAAGLIAAAPAVAVHHICSPLSPIARLILSSFVLGGAYSLILLYPMGQKQLYFDIVRQLRKRVDHTEPQPIALA
jgi:PST family polysaccharide transporter